MYQILSIPGYNILKINLNTMFHHWYWHKRYPLTFTSSLSIEFDYCASSMHYLLFYIHFIFAYIKTIFHIILYLNTNICFTERIQLQLYVYEVGFRLSGHFYNIKLIVNNNYKYYKLNLQFYKFSFWPSTEKKNKPETIKPTHGMCEVSPSYP